MTQLRSGVRAPDFELKDVSGRSYRLSSAFSQGPVILVFFKISCPTCQFTFPHIQRIFAGAGKDWGSQLWAISQDDAEETRQFAARFGITFNILIDEYPYEVSSAYGIAFVPTIFVIDPDGKISLSDNGFTKSSLNRIAGFELFTPNDGLPATRPG
jgi:peroxiredoxin